MYQIQAKDSARAKWRRPAFSQDYEVLSDAIAWAREMDEQGGGVYRVVQADTNEVVWTPRYDRVS